jgi:hypothetical protein
MHVFRPDAQYGSIGNTRFIENKAVDCYALDNYEGSLLMTMLH